MYKKSKRFNFRARDARLESICSDLIKWNEDTIFLVSKKFVLTPKKELGEEIRNLPLVISSTPIDELVIPSSYALTASNELTTWCDDDYALVKLVYSPIKFYDEQIKGKKIQNFYMDIEKQEEINKLKKF